MKFETYVNFKFTMSLIKGKSNKFFIYYEI